jgi:NAD(P)-dependent dehydrogenase (short-subunit alcohol dehydrogenase family)
MSDRVSGRLVGKVAIVTGGGRGIGEAICRRYAIEGAKVVVADVDPDTARDTVRRIVDDGGDAIAVTTDVSDGANVAQLLAETLRAYGTVDILVNNAAIDPKVTSNPGVMHSSRFEAFPVPQWQTEIAVGLTGAMLCAQEFGGQMARRGRGVILNIASDLGVIAPDQRLYRQPHVAREEEQPVKPVTYSVIKHGLIGLTKYLATYWADHGVRVNAISPGGVFNNQDPAFVERLTRLIPMGRMAEVDEYRAAVQFLCSDASSYMTGQNLVMDGGRSVW